MRMLRQLNIKELTAVLTRLFFGARLREGVLLFFLLLFSISSFGQDGVTITSTGNSPTSANPIPLTFTFDSPVNGFGLEDVARSGGGLSDFSIETPNFAHTGFSKRLSSFELDALNPDLSNASKAIVALDIDKDGAVYALTFNDGIYFFNSSGNSISGNPQYSKEEFSDPRDIAVGPNGTIYVADSGNNRIVSITSDQSISYLGENILKSPSGLAVDKEGKIFVADTENNRVVVFDLSNPPPQIINGTGGQSLLNPVRLAVDSKGLIYVNDLGNSRIQIFNSGGNYLETIESGDNTFSSAGSILVDDYGFLYVADFNSVSLENFLSYQDIDPLELLPILLGEQLSIKVFNPADFSAAAFSITESVDIPVDLALKPCGYLAVNNGDAVLGNLQLGLPPKWPANFLFDLRFYNHLPDTFNATFTIDKECELAKVSVPAGIGQDKDCQLIPASDSAEFAVLWDKTDPLISCPTEDLLVVRDSNGIYKIPDLFSLIDDTCDPDPSFVQNPAKGTEITAPGEIKLSGSDAAGNSTTCTVSYVLEEISDPLKITCPSSETFSVSAGECGTIVNYDPPEITGGSNEIEPVLKQGLASGDFFPLGPTKVTYTATDASGISSECSFTITVIDDEKPEKVTCPPDLFYEVPLGETGRIVNFDTPEAFDHCSVVTVDQTEGLPSGSEFPLGPTTNTFILSDAAGNEITCEFTVTITELPDTEKPIINCPTDIVVSADPDACGAEVEYELPTATDNSGFAPVSKTGGPESDSFFNVGDTFVYFEAKDEAGNSATCMLKITVVDEQAPVANCVSDFTVYLDENETASITAEDLDNGSTDNCEIVSKTLSQYNFTSADIGVLPVNLMVTDASGLSDECPVQVTVKDTPAPEGPEAVCKDISVVLDESGTATITAGEVSEGADSSLKLDIDISSFDCSNLGENNVRLTVTDPATGLSDFCISTVTVVDENAPEVVCTPLTVYLNSQGTVMVSAEAVGQDSFDNCRISQMFLDKNTFSVGDVGQQKVKLTAVDGSGNESSCETVITVEPYEELPGGVICPEDEIIPLDEDGEVKNLRVKYEGSADLEFELSRTYFTCADIGPHSITVSWTGDFTGSCSSEVTIVDNTPPSISCVSNLALRLNASGSANISAEDLIETADDNCRIEEMYLDKTSFSAEDLGEQTVKVTVVDNSGNESFCQLRVNVLPFEDEGLPIQCAESIVVELDETGKASINPRDVYSGGTGSVQFTLSKEDFSCSDLGINKITFSYTTPQESGSCEIEVKVRDPLNACVTAPPVEPPAEEGFLLLYPNPSHGKVKVIAPASILLERAEVYDMRGRFLFSREFDLPENAKNSYDLDLSELQSGVYNITFFSNDEKYMRRAIISND